MDTNNVPRDYYSVKLPGLLVPPTEQIMGYMKAIDEGVYTIDRMIEEHKWISPTYPSPLTNLPRIWNMQLGYDRFVFLSGMAVGDSIRGVHPIYYAHMIGSGTACSSIYSGLMPVRRNDQSNCVFRMSHTSYNYIGIKPTAGLERVVKVSTTGMPQVSLAAKTKAKNIFTILDKRGIYLPIQHGNSNLLREYLVYYHHREEFIGKMIAALNIVSNLPFLLEWGEAILDYFLRVEWRDRVRFSAKMRRLETSGDCLACIEVLPDEKYWHGVLQILKREGRITL